MKSSSAHLLPSASLAGKVVLVIAGLGRGGAEVQVYELATRLSRRGWQVTVVSILPLTGWAEALRRNGVAVASLDLRWRFPNPWALVALARLIRRLRPDIVHAHMVHANLLARIARPFASMPVLVCTAHSINEGGRLRERLYQITDRFSDLTTQVSEAGLAHYRRIGAISARTSLYMPNGIDLGQYAPASRDLSLVQGVRVPRDAFFWLAVGRIADDKDYPTMLAAFAQVARVHPEAKLVVAGGGTLERLLEIAAEFGIAERVEFLGLRDDIPRLLNAADALVMSSRNEGLPMVLLEAAAARLPVVATDVGGVGEIVSDTVTGFVVPPRDPFALAKAMLRLMALPAKARVEMGRKAMLRVTERFEIETVVSRWEVLYNKLLSAGTLGTATSQGQAG